MPPLYLSRKMTTDTFNFTPRACPDCGNNTGLVHLGTERPREVCGLFGCSWDGRTL